MRTSDYVYNIECCNFYLKSGKISKILLPFFQRNLRLVLFQLKFRKFYKRFKKFHKIRLNFQNIIY